MESRSEKLTEGNDWQYKLYLSRVEEAAMGKLVEAINSGEMWLADRLVSLMQELSIV